MYSGYCKIDNNVNSQEDDHDEPPLLPARSTKRREGCNATKGYLDMTTT